MWQETVRAILSLFMIGNREREKLFHCWSESSKIKLGKSATKLLLWQLNLRSAGFHTTITQRGFVVCQEETE